MNEWSDFHYADWTYITALVKLTLRAIWCGIFIFIPIHIYFLPLIDALVLFYVTAHKICVLLAQVPRLREVKYIFLKASVFHQSL